MPFELRTAIYNGRFHIYPTWQKFLLQWHAWVSWVYTKMGCLVSLSSVIVKILTLILSFFCCMSFAVCSLKGRLLAMAIFRTVSAVSCIYLMYVFRLCRRYIFVKDSASLSVSVESLSTKN